MEYMMLLRKSACDITSAWACRMKFILSTIGSAKIAQDHERYELNQRQFQLHMQVTMVHSQLDFISRSDPIQITEYIPEVQ